MRKTFLCQVLLLIFNPLVLTGDNGKCGTLNFWENPTRLKVEFEKKLGPGMLPSDEDIAHAKWLGKYMIVYFTYNGHTR